jgi:gas vesicle protein GvpK
MPRLEVELADPSGFAAVGQRARVELEPGKIERGLVKLVLSLVELLRQVMEKQAMRRIDSGGLSADEVERLGGGLMELEAKIRDLQAHFEIDSLNIDLGPAGRLLDE